MSDEAVLRIVLDDKSRGGGAPPTGGGSGAGTGNTGGGAGNSGGGSFDPVAEAQKRFEADQRRAAIDAEYAKLRPIQPPFDPAEEAKKRLEADQRRSAIEAEYAKLVPPTVEQPFDPVEVAKKRLEAEQRRAAADAEYAKLVPPVVDTPFDPVAEAQKRLEKDKQRAEIDAEYAKLIPPTVELAFDPVKEAQKRLEKDKERAAIDEEYAKLKPTPAFDPSEEARKRREGERRRAQIDAAYKDEYGDEDKESGINQFLKVADSLRGTLGGIFGNVVGAALDVVSGVHKAQVKANKEKRDEDLLAEAQETTKAVAPEQISTSGPATPSVNSAGASDIADKFKVPGAGTGTATGGPKNTTQGADIAKVGTDVSGGAEGIGAAVGGGEAAIASSVPIIGAALALGAAIDKGIKDSIKGAIGAVGGAVKAIASADTDPSVPVGQLGEAASNAGDKLGFFGYSVIVAGESLKALSGIMQALDQTAQRYGEYSAPIAQAQAIAEVRHTMGDLRRAQEISPEMVRYIQAQSDLQQKFEDIKIRLLTKIMPIVTRMLEILEVIMTGGENILKGIELLALPLTKMLKILADWFGWEQDRDREEVEDPTTILFDPRFETGGLGTPRSPGFTPDL